MTPHLQARANVRRTWFLMGSFLTIVIAAGWALSYVYGDPTILYAAVAFSFIGNFFSYFNSDKVALKMSGAKPMDPKNADHRVALRIVENLAISQGMPTPRVYIIEDSAMNAFATGRNPKNAAMAFTTGIIKELEKKELEGVAAHELSHIKNRDILVMTIVVVLVGFISIIADMFMRGAFKTKGGDNKVAAIVLVIGIIFAILSPFIAKAIQLAISRKREYLADASGVEMTRYPEGLASALEKISKQNKPVKRAGTATAHLYISSPFLDRDKTTVDFLERIFSTHPPIQQRINNLRGMNQ